MQASVTRTRMPGQSNTTRSGGKYLVANLWGVTSRGLLEKYRKRLAEYRHAGSVEGSEELLGDWHN